MGCRALMRQDQEMIGHGGSMCHQNALYSPSVPPSTELPQIPYLPQYEQFDESIYGSI